MTILDFMLSTGFRSVGDSVVIIILQDQGVWHTSKYMDTADVPSGPEAEPQMWDRRLFYCVPVCPFPGMCLL
jgi:hypothetical protein